VSEFAVADLGVRIAFCDPASGKRLALKRVRARSAIVVIAMDLLSRIFVLHAWADRCSTDALTMKILEINAALKPRTFGIEANAMQSLYGDMVSREAKFKGTRLPLMPVNQPTKIDKDWRIRMTLQPVIADGRLFVQPQHYELKSELTTFPMSPTKDLIDALASAINLLPRPATRIDKDTERDAHLAYLRATNAPMHYIEQVASSYSMGGVA